MTPPLHERVALITGASRGIGRATARALAAAGADLVLTARTETDLRAAADEVEALGRRALVVPADASQADDVARLEAAAIGAFGRVDILVNNAGVGKYGPLTEQTIDDYDWMMNTNMRSSFLCTRAFLPGMLARQRGWIVFVASVAGLKGLPNEAVYCATKFAQVGFAQALDYETRERGIKVSVVAPGGVHTHFGIGTGRTAGDPMLARMMDAEAIADAVLFAVTQPPKARVFLIGMRPMSEPL